MVIDSYTSQPLKDGPSAAPSASEVPDHKAVKYSQILSIDELRESGRESSRKKIVHTRQINMACHFLMQWVGYIIQEFESNHDPIYNYEYFESNSMGFTKLGI